MEKKRRVRNTCQQNRNITVGKADLIRLQRIKYSDFRLSSGIEWYRSGKQKLFLGVPWGFDGVCVCVYCRDFRF